MHAVEIKQLKKTYQNNVVALKDISLKVAQGDFYALLGPNGAGKSTTIGILTSLVNKSSGQVYVFGHDLDKEPNTVKSLIGSVPQEFNFGIFQKVIHILANQAGYYGIPRSLARRRAEKYLKQLNLWDKRDQQARFLSGGQKRRLMIARALLHEPPLLILDEPTAGVDIEIRRSMWRFLRTINKQGTTIILTTHYLEEAESLCKNVGIINHGRIIEDAPMAEVLKKLHMETFVLNTAAPLSEAPKLDHYPARLADATTLEVDIYKGRDINTVFKLLSEKNIYVLSMRNKANRLEELFIRITQEIEFE